jgi:hypothetical protein
MQTSYMFKDGLREFSPLSGEDGLLEDGTQAPFPIVFVSRVDSHNNSDQFDMPTADLAAVPEDILYRLNGHYFGWVGTKDKIKTGKRSSIAENHWFQAVISAVPLHLAQLTRVNIAHPSKKRITVRFIGDDMESFPLNIRVEARVMGFVRSSNQLEDQRDEDGTESEAVMINAIQDIDIAQTCLDLPTWSPGPSLKRQDDSKLAALENVKAAYADMRVSVQWQIDRVPFHVAGLRLRVDNIRGEAIGNGGLFVIR